MDEPQTPGEQLREWMKANGASRAVVAKACGVSPAAVTGWCAGDYRPDELPRARLERFTGGAVRAVAWRTVDEQRDLASVEPFAAAG